MRKGIKGTFDHFSGKKGRILRSLTITKNDHPPKTAILHVTYPPSIQRILTINTIYTFSTFYTLPTPPYFLQGIKGTFSAIPMYARGVCCGGVFFGYGNKLSVYSAPKMKFKITKLKNNFPPSKRGEIVTLITDET